MKPSLRKKLEWQNTEFQKAREDPTKSENKVRKEEIIDYLIEIKNDNQVYRFSKNLEACIYFFGSKNPIDVKVDNRKTHPITKVGYYIGGFIAETNLGGDKSPRISPQAVVSYLEEAGKQRNKLVTADEIKTKFESELSRLLT